MKILWLYFLELKNVHDGRGEVDGIRGAKNVKLEVIQITSSDKKYMCT